MVKIRLARHGAKKKPFYHIVAADNREKRDGRYIERLGYYNPLAKGQAVQIHVNWERADYWVGTGAQLSDRVASLFKKFRNAETKIADQVVEEAKAAINTEKPIESDDNSTTDQG